MGLESGGEWWGNGWWWMITFVGFESLLLGLGLNQKGEKWNENAGSEQVLNQKKKRKKKGLLDPSKIKKGLLETAMLCSTGRKVTKIFFWFFSGNHG